MERLVDDSKPRCSTVLVLWISVVCLNEVKQLLATSACLILEVPAYIRRHLEFIRCLDC